MTDIKGRLNGAADYLDYLYEGSRHIPTDVYRLEDERSVLLSRTVERPVAQFFYGGLPDVYLTLGPAVLPLLARWLRTEAKYNAGDELHDESCFEGACTAVTALAFADHVLKQKESAS